MKGILYTLCIYSHVVDLPPPSPPHRQTGGVEGGGARIAVCKHTDPLHIITSAYIIVFIHCPNSSAYSATGYIIVCIQGKASHWFSSGTMSGATQWSSAYTVSTRLSPATSTQQKTPNLFWKVFAVGVQFHALSSRFDLIFKEYPQAQRKGNLWQFLGPVEKNLTFL